MKKTVTQLNIEIQEKEAKLLETAEYMKTEKNFVEENKENMTEEEVAKKIKNIEDATADFATIKTSINALEAEKQVMVDNIQSKLDGTHSKDFTSVLLNGTKANAREEYAKAFQKAVKGDLSEYSKLLSTTDTDGTTANAAGALVPTFVEDMIEETLEHYKNLFDWARNTTIKGLLQIAVEVDNTGAVDHVEGSGAIDEEEITLEEIILQPQMVKKFIKWTDELELMSAVDLLDYLYAEFFKEIIKKYEYNMLNSTNTKGAQGIFPMAGTEYVAQVDAAGEALAFTHILQMLGKCRAGEKKFFMHQETFYNDVMGMTDVNGRPIFTQVAGKDGALQNLLYGIPVEFNDAFPTYAEATETDFPILLLGKDVYRNNFPGGITPTYVLDRVSLAEADENKLVGKLYGGGRIAKLNGASVLLKGATA